MTVIIPKEVEPQIFIDFPSGTDKQIINADQIDTVGSLIRGGDTLIPLQPPRDPSVGDLAGSLKEELLDG